MKRIIYILMVLVIFTVTGCGENTVSKAVIEEDFAESMEVDEQLDYKIGSISKSDDGHQSVDIKLTNNQGPSGQTAVVRFNYSNFDSEWALVNWDIIQDWE